MWRIIRRCLGREASNSVEPTTEPTANPQGTREPETTLLYLRIPLRQPTESSAVNVPLPHAASETVESETVESETVESETVASETAAARREVPRPSRPDQVAARRRARQQRVLRFAKHFTGMEPREARILIAMHRRSPHVLARESAAVLKRDWERFLLSSAGQRLAAGSEVPDIARLRNWITLARLKVAEAAARKQTRGPSVTPPAGGPL